eukprot:9179358-Alexandrium_andersonii.AAC.1
MTAPRLVQRLVLYRMLSSSRLWLSQILLRKGFSSRSSQRRVAESLNLTDRLWGSSEQHHLNRQTPWMHLQITRALLATLRIFARSVATAVACLAFVVSLRLALAHSKVFENCPKLLERSAGWRCRLARNTWGPGMDSS